MLQEKDYLLLEYLSQHPDGVKINQSTVPAIINRNFSFFGTDKVKHPDSIWVCLWALRNKKFAKEVGAGFWKIDELGKQELQHYLDENADKIFAQQCDKVAKYLISADDNKIASQQVSDALEIDIDTVDIIAEELEERKLVQLAINDGHYSIHSLSTLERFIRKSSFAKELERKQSVTEIRDSFNETTTNTTLGPNSPIASEGSKVEQTINQELKKEESKKWYTQVINWIWEQIKKPVIAALGSFVIGFISGRTTSVSGTQNTPQDSLIQSQSSKKPLEIRVSSNEDTTSLDNIQQKIETVE